MSCKALLSFCVLLCVATAFPQEKFTVTVDGVENTFENDQPSLSFLNASEFCTTGVWVVYDSENYLNSTRIIPNTNSECVDTPPQTSVRSIRFVGLHDYTSAPSVALFSATGLNGAAVTFVNELPHISFPINSLVTIGTRVELFEQANFQGASACLEIDGYHCRNGVCWDWELHAGDITWDINSAKSAKAGCGCTTPVKQGIPEHGDAKVPF